MKTSQDFKSKSWLVYFTSCFYEKQGYSLPSALSTRRRCKSGPLKRLEQPGIEKQRWGGDIWAGDM